MIITSELVIISKFMCRLPKYIIIRRMTEIIHWILGADIA